MLFFSSFSLFAQANNNTETDIAINLDSSIYTLCKTRAEKGKEIYVLNSRYKFNKNYRSLVGDDADFMFTFYIFPENNKLEIKEIQKPVKNIINNSTELLKKSKQLFSSDYSSPLVFNLLIKSGNKYYKFINCKIESQAFYIQEDPQFFPKFGAGSNRFELNLLSKPYTSKSIDSLRKVISIDSTALRRFPTWAEDFYDKWYIKSINRKENSLNYWIDLKNISAEGYSFGRVAEEITYKMKVGITSFKIRPTYRMFTDEYIDDRYSIIEFKFVEIVDLKSILHK